MKPHVFRKKPVEVEAIRWKGDNFDEIYAWGGGDISTTEGVLAAKILEWGDGSDDKALCIETLEGDMRADIGDWIIKGVKGEFYPCKDDIFRATYFCTWCGGKGVLSYGCSLCGDSGEDHECNDREEACPACGEGGN